jgi:O-antigen/teichoic acid export membrane protein
VKLSSESVISIKSLIQDTSFSMAAELINRAANVILFVAISRLLGAEEAGVYALAFSYTLVATRVTYWGLDQLLIRESSKTPRRIGSIFLHFLFIRICFSVLAWCALYSLTSFSLPNSGIQTRFIVLVIGLSVLPESINNICQSVFVAHQRMIFLVLARALVTSTKLIGGLLVLLSGGNLLALAVVIVTGSLVGMGFNLIIVFVKFVRFSWQLEWGFCIKQLKIAWPLAVSGASYILDNRLDIIILSLFVNETDIGCYNAAMTIISSLLLVPQAYRLAVFPAMARLFSTDREAFHRLYKYSLKYLILLALPLSISLTFLARPIISLVFGDGFYSTVPILKVMAWILPLLSLNVPVVRLIVTIDEQWIVARSMLIRLTTKALLGLILVSQYGALGAAGVRLFATLIMVSLNCVYAFRHVCSMCIGEDLLYLSLAAMGMGTVLSIFRSFFPGILILGLGVYFSVLFLTGVLSREERFLITRFVRSVVSRILKDPLCSKREGVDKGGAESI